MFNFIFSIITSTIIVGILYAIRQFMVSPNSYSRVILISIFAMIIMLSGNIETVEINTNNTNE